MIRPFGSDCYVLIQPDTQINKIGVRSQKAKFVGLSDSTKAYLYVLPGSRKPQTSRNVIFPTTGTESEPSATIEQSIGRAEKENIPLAPPVTPAAPNTSATLSPQTSTPPAVNEPSVEEPASTSSIPGQSLSDAPVPRSRMLSELKSSFRVLDPVSMAPGRATRSRASLPSSIPIATEGGWRPLNSPGVKRAKGWENQVYDYTMSNLLYDQIPSEFVFLTPEPETPLDINQARSSPNWERWNEAMQSELDNLKSKNTYVLADLPAGRKAVKSKWVYKEKFTPDGKPLKFKARLVAQGFSQVPGVDYDLTHAPSLRLKSFRLFLAIAAFLDLEIHGMDVVGAYVNGDLDHEIYMTQPPGFSDGTERVL